ncbi:hypothetical protein ASPSYDRAFT_41768 [Aspergillus sydowii CBS 593.65]|uniref:Uncharacterized protein n=1 Tax=Aspergillus sydowii CBS 593.65 TaxID=1036612 RepID=A0A1L9TUN1_9EURO|nr:uncharacterized protein ASPSYDRAFT_41768 [Aspergillus sydowii CBS 593.65]OJJ63058.1 hypothetical protein ASPSYDRAFT_41768 [Aspergillus sydowii CBS 593.65]
MLLPLSLRVLALPLCPLCGNDSLRSLPYQAGVFLVPAAAMITIALDTVKKVWSVFSFLLCVNWPKRIDPPDTAGFEYIGA